VRHPTLGLPIVYWYFSQDLQFAAEQELARSGHTASTEQVRQPIFREGFSRWQTLRPLACAAERGFARLKRGAPENRLQILLNETWTEMDVDLD
jgi:hypothetical protein